MSCPRGKGWRKPLAKAGPGRPPKDAAERGTVEARPDWSRRCEVCGQSPVVPITGMCGPCTFGEAETVGGRW
jgi:hypothetical protein